MYIFTLQGGVKAVVWVDTAQVSVYIFTLQGGVKAVVWVDTAQVSVMLAGVLALLIQGTKNVGGLNVVIQAATEAGRLQPWRSAIHADSH